MQDALTERLTEWVRLAVRRDVVARAALYAAVVGPILIAINHGDSIAAGDLPPQRWLKMGLTMLVPYLVSTFSSVGALRR